MKKFLALGLAAIFSAAAMRADQQNWNTANTFLRFETPFQSASPERVSLFNTEDLRSKHRADHNGAVQFVIFGNQNTNTSDAAAYYMPGGLETLVFNASIDGLNEGSESAVTYWQGVQGPITPAQFNGAANTNIGYSTGASTAGVALNTSGVSTTANALGYMTGTGTTGQALINAGQVGTATAANQFVIGTGVAGVYKTYDLSSLSGLVSTGNAEIGNFVIDQNKNLGVMRPWNFGVGYAPNVQFGVNQISESAFKSSITPTLQRSFFALGATWKQLLSKQDTGFFLELSTVLQRVTMDMNLNESSIVDLDAAPQGSNANWVNSWTNNDFDAGDTVAPQNITQAFAQEAWQYGKIDGAQSVTRLADIELKLGYQFVCEENVMSNMFLGIVIPTGNKAKSEYLAEPIVGNGFHFGLMFGGTQEIQLDTGSATRWSMRSDTNFRYLFQNSQVRSFDTVSNGQWSRYMMTWPTYLVEQENGEAPTSQVPTLRNYTPGINVFTQEVHVSPGAQARINEAIVLEHGSFKAEFGWNLMIRQAEEVSLVNDWVENAVTFVDASNSASSLYNLTRTIYNDAYQSTPVQMTAGASESLYNAASITAADLNIDSAASPAIYTNAPYLALGYAFNEEKSSVLSIGASYEVAATNGYIDNWTLWGKFGFTF